MGRAEPRADTEFERADEDRRQMLAYYAFTGAHLVMIVSIILVAAGITDAIHHLTGHGHRWWLGCGGGWAAVRRCSSWATPCTGCWSWWSWRPWPPWTVARPGRHNRLRPWDRACPVDQAAAHRGFGR